MKGEREREEERERERERKECACACVCKCESACLRACLSLGLCECACMCACASVCVCVRGRGEVERWGDLRSPFLVRKSQKQLKRRRASQLGAKEQVARSPAPRCGTFLIFVKSQAKLICCEIKAPKGANWITRLELLKARKKRSISLRSQPRLNWKMIFHTGTSMKNWKMKGSIV